MFSKILTNLKAGFRTAFKGTGKNDELDTATRNLVSKFTKGVVKEIVSRFPNLKKSTASTVGTTAILIGWALRKATNLSPFGDNLITDMAQEVADQFGEAGKDAKTTPEQEADKKKLMTNIAKLLINAQLKYARDINVEDFFFEFNDLMSKMNEKNQAAFVDMLSKFNRLEMAKFMKLTTEEKKKFFGHFFADGPEKPDHDPKSLKEFIREATDRISRGYKIFEDGVEKFDDSFKEGTPLAKGLTKYQAYVQNLKAQLENPNTEGEIE